MIQQLTTNPVFVRQYGVNDYYKLRSALCVHFAQSYRRGLVCWPKRFKGWQRSVFTIPPVAQRSNLQYWACLYHKPSEICLRGSLQTIGDGLFSRLNYNASETIVEYNGKLTSVSAYEKEVANGRGGYAVHINNKTVLNCFASCKANKCMASYANSPRNCVSMSPGNPPAVSNAKLVVDTAKKKPN
jgi:hypothetical protein